MLSTIRRYSSVVIYLIYMLLIYSGNTRADTAALTLGHAVRIGLKEEPGILAARAHAQSLTDKAISSSALPDPQIRVGLMNVPANDFNFNQDPMTQKQIGFRQILPKAGSRQAKRKMFEHKAQVFDYAAKERISDVIYSIRTDWLELYYWQHAKTMVLKSQALFSMLVKVTRSLYSVGRQNQQDMVRAELELSRLKDRLLTIETQIQQGQASLAQWVGNRIAQKPLSESLPNWPKPAELVELKQKLSSHPKLQMLNSKIESAQANIDWARSQYKPSIALDLNYGVRDDDLLGNERDDFFSVMVTMDIPLFTGKRQDKQINEARYRQDAAMNNREMLLREMLRQLESAYARWKQLQFRLELFNQTILRQSQIQSKAALQAYQNDTSDFNDVVRAYIAELNTQLEFIRLEVDEVKILSKLDYLVQVVPINDQEYISE